MKSYINKSSLVIIIVLMGCNDKDILYIHSKDTSNTITVITDDDIRYIIDGRHSRIPDSNYIKLNVERIDPISDAIQVCWNDEGYLWRVINSKAQILESKLDTTKYYFNNELPKDERGVPTQKSYVKDNCAVFDFLRRELLFDKGATLEFDD